MIDAIATLCHEFDVNFVLGGEPGECHGADDPSHYGLYPYYAINRIVKRHGGSHRVQFEVAGRYYRAVLWYQQKSGIAKLNHPSCDLDEIREYRISIARVDEEDPVGNEDGDIHIAPRNPGMEDADGDEISIPEIVGINCRMELSNIPFELYPEILRTCLVELGLDERYVSDQNLSPMSNIQQAARNVRIHRDQAGRLHARDGAITKIANVASDDRSGFRKLVQDDTEIPGYYHTATVDAGRAGDLVPHHEYPKEIKHYYPKYPDAFDEDHPLYHPKLEVSLARKPLDSNPKWAEFEQLSRELDELLLNVLRWAGYPVTAEELSEEDDDRGGGGLDQWGPYVADAYFEPGIEPRNRRLVEDPTPQLQAEQDNVVVRALKDGLEESDVAVIETLLSDGGQVAPQDVAEDHGYHLETIYSALDRLEELVEHNYGDLRLRSHYVADQLLEAIDRAEDAALDAAETAASVLSDGLASAQDDLGRFLDREGIQLDDSDDGLTIDLGTVESRYRAVELVKDGRQAWVAADWDPERWDQATVRYDAGNGRQQQLASEMDFPRPAVSSRRSSADTARDQSGKYSLREMVTDLARKSTKIDDDPDDLARDVLDPG